MQLATCNSPQATLNRGGAVNLTEDGEYFSSPSVYRGSPRRGREFEINLQLAT